MSDDGFIGLPPGIAPSTPDPNSGTVRRERPDRTRAGSDEIVFFPAVPGMPAPTPEPAPAVHDEIAEATRLTSRHSATTWRLVVPGHGTTPVQGVLFVGRNPSPTAGHPDAEVLAVNDEARSLSKTHAMLEVEEGVLWVHDLESTNGVWVVVAGEDPIEVVPGQRVTVPSGSDLELGDMVIQVEHS